MRLRLAMSLLRRPARDLTLDRCCSSRLAGRLAPSRGDPRRPRRRAGLATVAQFVAMTLDLARELVATRFSECCISGEQSRARSVTPFRYSVASATCLSATRGLRSLKISTSRRARSETCRATLRRRRSSVRAKLVGDRDVATLDVDLHHRLLRSGTTCSCSPMLRPCDGGCKWTGRNVGAGRCSRVGAVLCRMPLWPAIAPIRIDSGATSVPGNTMHLAQLCAVADAAPSPSTTGPISRTPSPICTSRPIHDATVDLGVLLGSGERRPRPARPGSAPRPRSPAAARRAARRTCPGAARPTSRRRSSTRRTSWMWNGTSFSSSAGNTSCAQSTNGRSGK